jgi:hypothetical protein
MWGLYSIWGIRRCEDVNDWCFYDTGFIEVVGCHRLSYILKVVDGEG